MKPKHVEPIGRIHPVVTAEGTSIEEMIRKALQSGEPIKGNAKLFNTERKEGVLPQFDIRTDRFDLAMTAADRVHASEYAKRVAAETAKTEEKPKAEA